MIVDDEQGYCEELRTNFDDMGYRTLTATSGREAIDLGVRFRPNVLVVDWMLRNHIHGLHVSEVLRLVCPDIETILITGFSSSDLKIDAKRCDVFQFIEKPFTLDMLESAVAQAAESKRAALHCLPVAVCEIDDKGGVTFANERARDLFEQTSAGRDCCRFTDLFEDDACPDLDAAVNRWVAALPKAEGCVHWQIRAQTPRVNGGRIIVILHSNQPRHLHGQLVEMLLEVKDAQCPHWPFDGHLLVLDGSELDRHLAVSMLEGSGGACYAASNPHDALRLLANDDEFEFMVLDDNLMKFDAAAFLKDALKVRKDLVIIANSNVDRAEDWKQLGVERFLHKPWRVNDLVDIIVECPSQA
jgi:DNA-binding NtrC family response regulator